MQRAIKYIAWQWLEIAAVASLVLPLLAATPTTGPAVSGNTSTTQPVRSAVELDAILATKIAAIEHDYDRQVTAARGERIEGLEILLDRAMTNKDLDQAVALNAQIKAAEAEQKADAPVPANMPQINELASLQKSLNNTTWEWGPSDSIRFQADGRIGNNGWAGRGLVTIWRVIDRRTVLLFIQSGRTDNRYAILTFSPNLDSFSGFSFDGSLDPLPVNHPMKL